MFVIGSAKPVSEIARDSTMRELYICIFTIIFLLLFLPTGFLFLQLICSKRKASSVNEAPQSCLTAVLIPAHNEEKNIAACILSLLPQLGQSDFIVVVADNCNDATSITARALGALVFERYSEDLIGKGYALDAGLKAIGNLPKLPDVVVIIDADCVLEDGGLVVLSQKALLKNRPVQAFYNMVAPNKEQLWGKLAEFAWRIKNVARPRGSSKLGLPCQLMGSGMAIPWKLLDYVTIASGNMVEDIQMGLDFALAGHAPIFCEDAKVVSFFPTSPDIALIQRTRWQHGHLATIFATLPKLAITAFLRRDLALGAVVLDLAIPPLTLLILLHIIFLAFSFVCMLLGFPIFLLVSLLLEAVLFFTFTLAWVWHGQDLLSERDLASTFLQVLSKIPFYIKAIFKRERRWIPTSRD